MASSFKRCIKSCYRETYPRGARDSAEVTLTNTTCLTLTLPVTAYQEIVCVLTSELIRLRQQLNQTAGDKKLIETTPSECVSPRDIRSNVKRKLTKGERRQKQAVHKYSVKPNSVCCNCRSGKRHSLPSQFSRAHNSCASVTDLYKLALPAEAGNQKVNKPTPAKSGEKVNKTATAETQPAGTASCKNNDREMSTNDRRCLHCLSSRVVTTNNCSVQTLPMTETKGINTKLKSRQTRIQPGEQVVHPKDTVQRQVKSTRERRPAAELKQQLSSEKQEQLAVTAKLEQTVEKEKVEATTEVVTKSPQSSSELVEFTRVIINELTTAGVITTPDQPRNVCVFCHENHHISSCPKVQEKTENEKKYTYRQCHICRETEHIINECKWLLVVDLIHSLKSSEQQILCALCPYLKLTVDNPNKSLEWMFWWYDLKEGVNNTISEWLTLGTKGRVQKARAMVTPSEPGITEIKMAETIPVPASAKYRMNKRTVTPQEERQCFFFVEAIIFYEIAFVINKRERREKMVKVVNLPKTLGISNKDCGVTKRQHKNNTLSQGR
ncbi:hypothetical protein BsWGS_23886 [Bradybaena similaris]